MSFQQIIALLVSYKYLILFPLAIAEGPIITVIAGFLSSLGRFNIYAVYAVVVAGDVVGDGVYYAFGYYGRQKFTERWGRLVGITTERVLRLEKHFEKHSGKTLVIGKLSHAVGGVVLVAAGMAKVRFWKFIWYNFISTLPKSLILLLIGFYFGETYNKINKYFDYTAIGTISLAVIFFVTYFVVRKVSKKYENENNR
ncbi:MAG: DedA family protein [Candidatus Azambacteria bacterium]|nr:DedA family protein [Candidatus Azambacteria bacterium]